MKFKAIFILTISASVFAAPVRPINFYAKKLGWIPDKRVCYLCDGYYRDFLIPYSPNPLLVDQSKSFNVSSDQTTYSLSGGATILDGHVRVARPGEEITADLAHVFYTSSGDPSYMTAVNNVHYHADGKLIIGEKGYVDLLHDKMKLENVLYRSARNAGVVVEVKNKKTGKTEKHLRQLTGWGTADTAEQVSPNLYVFKNATYATCPPTKSVWHVKAKVLTLDKKAGQGKARNVVFYVKKWPVFFSPYFSFPLNKDRKSGFLLPSYSHNTDSGYMLSLPYYFNLAPNYDATLTPKIMTNRGVLLDGLFRYLTPKSAGNFRADYIFNDTGFRKFQSDAKTKYAGQQNLGRLQNASDNRYAFAWKNQTTLNPQWSDSIDFSAVSDDYFIRDFKNGFDNSNNRLTQQAQINYAGEHWSFLGNLLNYQTLHPVDQDVVNNQYAKLPQLQFNGYYPDFYHLLSFSMTNEIVRFAMPNNPGSVTNSTTGDRLNLRPALSLPLMWPFGFLTPRIQMQMTKEDLKNPSQGNPAHPGIAIPIMDVKGGLFFDRAVHLFHQEYHQTLEPSVYYLYVPYRDQTQFPVFDTTLNSFNYNFIFADNRFTGIDRVGDANQLGVGLTTRFLDEDTGEEKAKASIGELYYFRNREVLLPNNGTQNVLSDVDKERLSPVAAAATYHFNPAWNVNAGLTWNQQTNQMDNQNASLGYQLDGSHLLNLGYDYVRGGNTLSGAPKDSPSNDLKQTNLTGYWKISPHWSIMGRWNYNWSHGYAQTYFAGVAYESCCWAIRGIYSKSYSYLDNHATPQFDHTYYIQIALKGLSNFGYGDPSGFLMGSIPGYQDTFGQEV